MIQKEPVQVIGLLLVAAGWKLAFVLGGAVPFNSDEAVVALMARHIRLGERPIFFYGQAYMGSLDAWLVAGGFALLGENVWVIRLVQTLLYLGVILCVYFLAKILFNSSRPAILSAMLLAIPAVNTTVYTTASLGGYGEALLLGSLMLLTAFQSRQYLAAGVFPWRTALLWAFLAGLGWWANGISLVFSVPTALYIAWLLFRKYPLRGIWPGVAAMLAGFLLGSAPWWLYAVVTGPAHLVTELLGGAVAVESTPWPVQVASHLVNLVLLGSTALFGLRPPWEVRWLVLPLLPFVLAYWLAAVGMAARMHRRRPEIWVLFGVIFLLIVGFLFTPFGVDPSGRYFLPLIIPLAIFGAGLACKATQRPVRQFALIGLVVAFQALGTIQALWASPAGLTTQFFAPSILDHRYDDDLMRFLESEGETRGYSTYWVAYPLAFQSAERLVFVPALPYHPDLRYTPRDNRYRPYQTQVEASSRVAYIASVRSPSLSKHLQDGFRKQGITWSERVIGDYQIFFRLSRPVRPEEIGLGLAKASQ